MNLFPDIKISFNKAKLVKSISFDQEEILQGIMQLYCKDGFECDPCYNTGSFYFKSIPQPKYKFDLYPRTPDTIKNDCRELPFQNKEIKTLIFDPPWLLDYEREQPTQNKMKKRYGGFRNQYALFEFLDASIKEFSRVIKQGGFWLSSVRILSTAGENISFQTKLIRSVKNTISI